MAGGKGERFWPRSRVQVPKQFLSLLGEETMLQTTVSRLRSLLDLSQIFVVTGERYAELIASQLPELPADHIIVEPMARNTAPCIALAAQYIESLGYGGEIAFLPSDHYFGSEAELLRVLDTAYRLAGREPAWITLGICPTAPETGYGYIQRGKRYGDGEKHAGVYEVARFVEKPNRPAAEAYVANGDFYWNSGMYVVSTDYLAQSFETYEPDMWRTIRGIVYGGSEPERTFALLPDISIDYAVAEREKRLLVVETDLVWNDLGSWTSIASIRESDGNGHVVSGVDYVSLDSTGCVVDSSQPGLVALLGVHDLVFVRDKDVFLVCAKEKAQDVKSILKELRTTRREVYL
jgi:mannose-1-phosphate guanylyltransferase